jgi:hypothetical protein
VVELCEQSRFSLEAIRAFFVSCELLGEDFDGNVSSEFRVFGSIDLSG